MLFNSYTFILVFLPLTYASWRILRIRHDWATGLLVLASLIFYAYWDWQFLPLILASIFFNYWTGRQIAKAHQSKKQKTAKISLVIGITVNLLTLGAFKYLNFLNDSFAALTGSGLRLPDIILPIGISFYTFQQIAYIADVYQKKTESYRLLNYMLFVCFFPQLIAGPIVHHKEMMPQFAKKKSERELTHYAALGTILFIIGLFKKVVIADRAAGPANAVFDSALTGQVLSLYDGWLGALCYTLQIYFDFSAYTDMALGLGLLFGIRLPRNFNSPYKATSLIDFWRRWHMTLSHFLRDYLYIPLGGNRKGEVRRYANILITMVLGGIWHGAGWTFMLWGAIHGVFLCLNHLWRSIANIQIPAWPARFLTFFIVVIAWVFFRAENLDNAFNILQAMSGWESANSIIFETAYLWKVGGLLLICWIMPNSFEIKEYWEKRLKKATPLPYYARLFPLALGAMLFMSLLDMNKITEFLYFQF